MVKYDLPALKELVLAIRKKVNGVITSVTCSTRSELLCREVGIPVHQGIAFLFPMEERK
jgi:hypothetical protein